MKNGYAYTKQWFDFVFETDENITPMHTALYLWTVEMNNRMKWCDVFGLPTDYSMKAIGTKTYKSYKRTLNDLINWGFIRLVTKSYNQHTCNQVALVLKSKALTKAPPLALVLKSNIYKQIKLLKSSGEEKRKIKVLTDDTI